MGLITTLSTSYLSWMGLEGSGQHSEFWGGGVCVIPNHTYTNLL